jgi:hypothetical protein
MWNQHLYNFFEHQTKKDQIDGEVANCGWTKESDFLGFHSW